MYLFTYTCIIIMSDYFVFVCFAHKNTFIDRVPTYKHYMIPHFFFVSISMLFIASQENSSFHEKLLHEVFIHTKTILHYFTHCHVVVHSITRK